MSDNSYIKFTSYDIHIKTLRLHYDNCCGDRSTYCINKKNISYIAYIRTFSWFILLLTLGLIFLFITLLNELSPVDTERKYIYIGLLVIDIAFFLMECYNLFTKRIVVNAGTDTFTGRFPRGAEDSLVAWYTSNSEEGGELLA